MKFVQSIQGLWDDHFDWYEFDRSSLEFHKDRLVVSSSPIKKHREAEIVPQLESNVQKLSFDEQVQEISLTLERTSGICLPEQAIILDEEMIYAFDCFIIRLDLRTLKQRFLIGHSSPVKGLACNFEMGDSQHVASIQQDPPMV